MTSESAASALMRFSSTSRRTRSRSPGSWSASSCAPRMSPWAGPIRSVTSFWSAASSESAAAAAARKRAPSLSTSDARMLRRGAADRSPHARTNAAPRATPAATPMPLRTLGMNLVRLRPRLLARLGRQSIVLRGRLDRERREGLEQLLVHVAPCPALSGLEGLDDRMLGPMEVPSCVSIRRVVAAPDVPVRHAAPQVHPGVASFEAFLAAERARRHGVMPRADELIEIAAHRFFRSESSTSHSRIDEPVRPLEGSTPADVADPRRSITSARNEWMVAITCAPSPTAEATRFVDPLRRPAANVPDREHSVQARLEGASPGGDVGTRLHEAFRIERDAGARKPSRVRVRADEEEEMTDLSLRLLAGEGVPPADRLQNAAVSLERGYRRLRLHLDVRQPGDAIVQVPRHAGFEAGPADEEPHLRALARQVDHRLARGVSCANDRNLLPCAEPRLDRRSPVVDAGTLVRGEVRNVEPAVAGAAGDDDGTRHHPLSVRQAQVVAPAPRHSLAPQAHDLVRDGHLGAEFLRLVEGARHQGKAGDAGREPEVVLDPCRRARLTSERARIENHHRETLGGAVDGGAETCGSSSHDDDIMEPGRVQRHEEADATRELDLARVAEKAAVRAEHDRQLRLLDPKAVDQRPCRCVGVRVEVLVRVPVPREEPFQAEDVRIIGPAHDHRPRDAGLDQPDTSQDESAHDAFSGVRFGDKQLGDPARRDDERLDGPRRACVHESGSARQLGELAEEGTRRVRDDGAVRLDDAVLRDGDLSAQDHDEAWARLTSGHESIAGVVRPRVAEAAKPIDLRGVEPREHLIVAGLDDRLRTRSHSFPRAL